MLRLSWLCRVVEVPKAVLSYQRPLPYTLKRSLVTVEEPLGQRAQMEQKRPRHRMMSSFDSKVSCILSY